jgi:hypothetical protein
VKRLTTAVTAAAMLLGCATANAHSNANTLAVDDDAMATPKNCDASTAASSTIQGAVTAASAGDTIVVCPGTYVEQVTVPSGKDKLTLYSSVRRGAIIKAPSTSNADYNLTRPDIVRVEGAKSVTFSRFTISGPLADDQFCNERLNSAVHILGGGSATLADNRITQARSASEALRGCQNGFGVQVGRTFESDTGTAWLIGNMIDDYQKGGIYVDNVGSKLIAAGNLIKGPDLAGANPVAAPNGVQISRGADAFFEFNYVLDNVFPGVTAPTGDPVPGLEPGQASGILLFNDDDGAAGEVKVSRNYVRHNDTNLALFNRDKGLFEDNLLLDATFYDGIYADVDSSGNRFEDNSAFDNEEHDCHDDSNGGGTAGTANVWKNNRGETQNRPGLCRDKRGHNDHQYSHHKGNHYGYANKYQRK